MQDNPYVVEVSPEQFHELLSAYETFVQWCRKDMTPHQWELSQQVLTRLQTADETHVCVDEQQTRDWTKEFPLTSVSRTDLLEAGFTEQQITALTDEDMTDIASEMEDWYCENGFWTDLENVVQNCLAKKTQPLGEPDETR